jgi:hypothetical protein
MIRILEASSESLKNKGVQIPIAAPAAPKNDGGAK